MAHPTDTAGPVPLGDYVPEADERLTLYDVAWDDFEKFLSIKGERAVPRMAYLDGCLELMSPSSYHEHYRFFISRLLERYMLELGIEFSGYGSWTLKRSRHHASKEPDECYVFGKSRPDDGRERPDLAIEIAWTRGGIDTLEIYRRLGVPEVWIWKQDVISVYALGVTGYEQRAESQFVPGIDLELLCKLAHSETLNEAVGGLEQALSKRPR